MRTPDIELDHDYAKYYNFPNNDTIVDLGATIGEFSRIYETQIRDNNIRMVCVEPEKRSFSILQKYHNGWLPNCKLLNVGVWKEDTELEFTTTTNPWCNMFDITGHDVSMIARTIEKVTYPVWSLDHILSEFDGEVGLLKADIEGAEIEVFTNCNDLRRIKHLAIAAYHVVDGKETWETLQPYFETVGYRTVVENIPYGHFPAYTTLYAWRE